MLHRLLAALIGGFAVAGPAAAQTTLSAEEAAIVARVEANAEAALDVLETSVNINSGTLHPEGVREAGAHMAAAFEAIGFATEWIDLPDELERGGHFKARIDGDEGNRLLLIGHLDTVFPPWSPFQTFRREGDIAYGPGVADMKGGNVVVLFALRALHEAGVLEGADIQVLFTGDEEKPGQPVAIARAPLLAAAAEADVALNFEGGQEGVVVTSRRGSSSWRLTTRGLRRHSSGIFSEEVGAGAVFEMARILNAFYEELAPEDYLTFNPGVIVGGTQVDYDPNVNSGTAFGKTNVVAQEVTTHGGLRFISEAQKEAARNRMRAIAGQNLPHTSAEIEFFDSYPAMTPTAENAALLKLASEASQALGLGALTGNDPARRGAADISFVAPIMPAAMDGLGVLGRGAHSEEEFMEIASLEAATKRAALMIYRLTRSDAPRFERSPVETDEPAAE